MTPRRVRLLHEYGLFAIYDVATGLWFAGFLTAENRDWYITHYRLEVVK